jgi:hypothetical protein
MSEKSSFNAANTKAELEAYFARMEMATAPAWRPESGDTIVGEIVGLKMGDGGEYGPYPIVVLKTIGGTGGPMHFAVHAFHTLLREALKELKVEMGSRIVITYLGTMEKNVQKDPEKPQSYHMYYVEDFDKAQSADVDENFSF